MRNGSATERNSEGSHGVTMVTPMPEDSFNDLLVAVEKARRQRKAKQKPPRATLAPRKIVPMGTVRNRL